MNLVRGEQAIMEFIDRHCSAAVGTITLPDPVQMSSSYQLSPLPLGGGEEDGCTIEQVCADPAQQSPGNLP